MTVSPPPLRGALQTRFFDQGKAVVTCREFARTMGVSLSAALDAVWADVRDNPDAFELDFVVSSVVRGDGADVFLVKRFKTREEAEAYAAADAGRSLNLHSVSSKSLAGALTPCQRAGSKSSELKSSSGPAQLGAYPLLSRTATAEKKANHSSGDLSPRSPLESVVVQRSMDERRPPASSSFSSASQSAFSAPPPLASTESRPRQVDSDAPNAAGPGAAAANKVVAGDKVQDAVAITNPSAAMPRSSIAPPVHTGTPAKPSPPRALAPVQGSSANVPAALPSAVQGVPVRSHSTGTTGTNDTDDNGKNAEAVPASETAAAAAAPPPKPVKKQRSLFEIMNLPEPPLKRLAREDAESRGSTLRKERADSNQTATTTTATAKKPGRPAKETKSLAKLAKASAKGAAASGSGHLAAVTTNTSLVDDEVVDSDDERDEEDEKRFLQIQAATLPVSRGRKNSFLAEVNMIPCEEAVPEESSTANCAPDDDFVLGDAATLTRSDEPLAAPLSPTPAATKPLVPTPTRTVPVKRARETDSAPPVPLHATLNVFFNDELIRFQKRYTKEDVMKCTQVNGEYVYEQTAVYRSKEDPTQVLTNEEYHSMHKEITDRFEKQKQENRAAAATAATQGHAVEPAAEGTKQPKKQAAVPKSPAPTQLSQGKTLLSYFAKKQ